MNLEIFTDNVEEQALIQIHNIMNSPAFKNEKVRIMPDVHAGKGCVIGFTSTFSDKIIPNVVGVDIGCGVTAVNLGNVDIDLEQLDQVIREFIPYGREVHKEFYNENYEDISNILLKHIPYLSDVERLKLSLGTLGGGNHYIEVDESKNGDKWLVVHSGSRNLGVQIAKHHQEIAISNLSGLNKYKELSKALIETYKANGWDKEIANALKVLKTSLEESQVDNDLAYLDGEYFVNQYLEDMRIAQIFASYNRFLILDIIMYKLGLICKIKDLITSVHNYIDIENKIIRKGSISAEKGQKLLIPLNMRDGIIIGVGKGNPDWNNSAPHGAGRLMSRNQAKEQVSLEDFQKSMEGIYTTSVSDATLDESPFAYKPAQEIIEKIQDTVEIIEVMKPIYNFKADN